MILSIDQGTTGTTCLVFDGEAQLVGRGYREFEQHFPKPGWVEHDANDIWEAVQSTLAELRASLDQPIIQGQAGEVSMSPRHG